MNRNYLFILLALSLTACYGPYARKLTRIQLGMTREEVIKTMGQPTSISATEGIEYLNYRLRESRGDWTPTSFFVRIKKGTVDAFGRLGDFDSTKPLQTSSDVNLNINKH